MCGDLMPDKVIEELFREHYQGLMIYATAVLGDSGVADDMVQEVFKIVCKKATETDLAKIEYPKAWLRKILKYVMLNHFQVENKKNKHEVSIETVLDGNLVSDDDILSLHIKYAGIVSDEDLELVIYIATTHSTYQDAADHFGLPSADACRKRYKKALSVMRKEFSK